MGILKTLCHAITALSLYTTIVSCSKKDELSDIDLSNPSSIISSTPWKTTAIKDKNGKHLPLNDPKVKDFVELSYFKKDGDFAIYDLENVLKSIGTWKVDSLGKTKNINKLKPDGRLLWNWKVQILELNQNIFTYRIIPNPDTAPNTYYDIVHSKSFDPEPTNGQKILASRPWLTTGAKNGAGKYVDLSDPRVSIFLGYYHFNATGSFNFYGLDNEHVSFGRWSLSADGKTKNVNGLLRGRGFSFNYDVDVIVLNESEFTYRIVTQDGIFFISHKPANHNDPF